MITPIHTPSHTHFPLSVSANTGLFWAPFSPFFCPAHVVFLLCVPCFYKWRLLLSPTATPWWWAGHCHVRRLCYAHPFTPLLVNNLPSFLKKENLYLSSILLTFYHAEMVPYFNFLYVMLQHDIYIGMNRIVSSRLWETVRWGISKLISLCLLMLTMGWMIGLIQR